MKINIIKTLLIAVPVLMISCSDMGNNTDMVKKLDEISDAQNVLLKKVSNLEKSVANLALASKNKPADKQQPPKADPNKVYNIPIGDSFTKGPDDAAVTLIEWTDFQ